MASYGISFLAPAKLNISMKVFGKRPDGMHFVRSVMVPVALYDEVTVERVPSGIRVETTDPAVPGGEGNTCYRAAARFLEWAGTAEGVSVRVRKGIPAEAGLGGGSSDAAATLKGLAALCGRNPQAEALRAMAAGVGADVPFFTLGVPALAEGIGDRLTRIVWAVPFWALIVKPGFGLSTAEGYARLGRGPGDPPVEGTLPSFRTWRDVAAAVENDFEDCWKGDRPEIRRIKDELLRAGARAAGLTGSGSAVFGLFGRREDARRAGAVLGGDGRRLFIARNI